MTKLLSTCPALTITVMASLLAGTAAVASERLTTLDSRAAAKNYYGSSTYKPIEQRDDLNYLLQRAPTAAGPEAGVQRGLGDRSARAAEKNYYGSPTYRSIEQEQGLNYLLEQAPTAAGPQQPKSSFGRDSRYNFKNYLGSSTMNE